MKYEIFLENEVIFNCIFSNEMLFAAVVSNVIVQLRAPWLDYQNSNIL